MTRYWFRPRKYGYGAAPKTWEGLALVAAFVVVIGFLTLRLDRASLTKETIVSHLLTIGGLTIAFVWVCWKKTDGPWRWRWGDDK